MNSDLKEYLNTQPDKKARFNIEKVTPEFMEVKTLNETQRLNTIQKFSDMYHLTFDEEFKLFKDAHDKWQQAESNRKTFRIPLPMAKENVEMPVFGVAEIKARTALGALYIELPEKVADDVRDTMLAAFKEIRDTRAASHPYSLQDLRRAWQEDGSDGRTSFEEFVDMIEGEKRYSLSPYQVGQEIEIEVDELGNASIVKE